MAGDVFHKWNSPVELVNWAIANGPWIHAIPGQHDLPYHSMDQIARSAFWTLCIQGARRGINLLYEGQAGMSWEFPGFVVQGFPWGVPLTPPTDSSGNLTVALVHKYVWIKGHSYPGAPKEATAHNLFKDGMGWDVIVCGDNHKGFLTKTKSGCVIFNCGGLQRRAVDEIDYHPQVGLLLADGSVEPHFLDISEDIITSSPAEAGEDGIQLGDFLERLKGLQGDSLDFQSAMIHALDEREVSPSVRQIVLEAMEQ